MARNKKNRIIQMAPHFSGFKPTGLQCAEGAEVVLKFEEYEAINLCDYELLTQAEAAKLMQVSRPTFTRIYESARRSISKALIEGSAIRFDIGNATSDDWYKCKKCEINFSTHEGSDGTCPLCKTNNNTENFNV